MPGSPAEPLDAAPVFGEPHVVVERRVGQQHSGGHGGGERSRCLALAQPALGFRFKLGCRGKVDPVGLQRVAGVAVPDPRATENAAKPAHDHGELGRRIAGLVVKPERIR